MRVSGIFFKVVIQVVFYIWVGDVGDYQPHGTSPGEFPEKAGPPYYRKTFAAALVQKLGVPPLGGGDGGGNVGGGFGGGGGVLVEEEAYGCSVLLIMDLYEELVQRPVKWVSKQ